MMCKEDATAMGLEQDDTVRVKGNSGELLVIVRYMDIARSNCAMYYPEANTIVPRRSDPSSRTPAFKGVVATIDV